MEKAKKIAEAVTGTVSDLLDWAKLKINRRRGAFRRTFDPSDPDNAVVLAVLAKALYADTSTFHVDPRAHAFHEGMRQAWIIIQHYSKLTEAELHEIYIRKDIE